MTREARRDEKAVKGARVRLLTSLDARGLAARLTAALAVILPRKSPPRMSDITAEDERSHATSCP
jgi:hypothetical protein